MAELFGIINHNVTIKKKMKKILIPTLLSFVSLVVAIFSAVGMSYSINSLLAGKLLFVPFFAMSFFSFIIAAPFFFWKVVEILGDILFKEN